MKNLRSKIAARAGKVIDGAVAAVAVPWVKRASLVDTAGGVCFVVGTALYSPRTAWLVAGGWLTLRALGIERSKL